MSETEKQQSTRHAQSIVITDDIVAKLVGLDVTMAAGFRRLDEKMDRFQKDLNENLITTNDKINTLDKEVTAKLGFKGNKIEGLDKRLTESETWQKVAMAKITVLIGAASIILVLFAPTVRSVLGVPG